jgi:cell division septation protein DedD
MDTELTFLISLLLEHKLPKPTKDAIAVRIKEVNSASIPQFHVTPARSLEILHQRPPKTAQSASTQKILDEIEAEKAAFAAGVVVPESEIVNDLPRVTPPQPIQQIAQTPAAVQALLSRQESIRIATSGKEEKGRTSPRKF